MNKINDLDWTTDFHELKDLPFKLKLEILNHRLSVINTASGDNAYRHALRQKIYEYKNSATGNP